MTDRQRISGGLLCAAMLCVTGTARGQDAAAPGGAPASAAPSGPAITVHGVVTNAATGAPLARALVEVFEKPQRGTLTDGDGRFELHGVPQGTENFLVRKPGFTGRDTDEGDGDLVTAVLVSSNTPELQFSLTPKNAIYGHVTLSSGLPGQGVGLNLLRQTVQNGRPSWAKAESHQSTPDGLFRFDGLHSGTYMVQSEPEFDNDHAVAPRCSAGAPDETPGYAAAFSNGTTDAAGAARIEVAAGQGTEVNLALTRTQFYRVQITAGVPAAGIWSFSQTLLDGNGQEVAYPVRMEKNTVCVYLPDGAYTLLVQASGDLDEAGRMRTGPNTDSMAGILEFSVDGKPATKLHVAMTQAVTTPTHVRFVPGPPKPLKSEPVTTEMGDREFREENGELMSLSALRVSGVGVGAETALMVGSNEMEYALDTVAPGSYWISVMTERQGMCVGAVTAGGQNLAQMPWVARNTGAGTSIDVELRTDCAKLTVSLPLEMGEANTAEDTTYFVFAVPEFDSVEAVNPVQLQRFGNRSVDMVDMTPGRYRVYVSRSSREIEYHNPAALNKLGAGQEVTLDPNGTATLTLEGVTP